MISGENPRCTEQTIEHGRHAGDQVFGGQKPSRVDAEGGERERIFLHGVALVFKQHHDHGNAEQHLRQRAEHVPGVSENFGVGRDELSDSHQAAPERKRKSELTRSEGHQLGLSPV